MAEKIEGDAAGGIAYRHDPAIMNVQEHSTKSLDANALEPLRPEIEGSNARLSVDIAR